MTTTTKAIGYVRVSSKGQEERGAGLATQRDRVRDYAMANGLELVDVATETASGAVREGELTSIEHRPVLSDLLDRGRRGEFAVLVVASFDRLSRDQLDAQLLKRWFAKYGVACLSAAGETNGAEGPLAELIDRLLGAIHDFERKRILERMRGGVAKRKEQGRVVQGNAPFGYRLVKATDAGGGKRLAPVPEPAKIVERIYRDASRGRTPGQIADALNEGQVREPGDGAARLSWCSCGRIVYSNAAKKGHERAHASERASHTWLDHCPSKRPAGRWNRTTIRKILENRAYRGELHGVKDAHPAIVTPRLWNAANRSLAGRGRGAR